MARFLKPFSSPDDNVLLDIQDYEVDILNDSDNEETNVISTTSSGGDDIKSDVENNDGSEMLIDFGDVREVRKKLQNDGVEKGTNNEKEGDGDNIEKSITETVPSMPRRLLFGQTKSGRTLAAEQTTEKGDEEETQPQGPIRRLFSRRVIKVEEDQDNNNNDDDDDDDDDDDEEEEEEDNDQESDEDDDDDSINEKEHSEKEIQKNHIGEINNSRIGELNRNARQQNNNRVSQQTFVTNSAIPQSQNQNRALHIKRVGNTVSRFVSSVFQPEEQDKHTNNNSSEASPKPTDFQEITFSWDHPGQVDVYDESPRQNSEKSETKNKDAAPNFVSQIDSFDHSQKNKNDKDESFLDKIGHRLDTFLEQHPEIMEFIDGPEGEDNKGFYRRVLPPGQQEETDSTDSNSNNSETQTKEIAAALRWKRIAELRLARLDALTKQLEQSEKNSNETIEQLKAQLEEANTKLNEKDTLTSTTDHSPAVNDIDLTGNDTNRKEVDLIELDNKQNDPIDDEANASIKNDIDIIQLHDDDGTEGNTPVLLVENNAPELDLIQLEDTQSVEANEPDLLVFEDEKDGNSTLQQSSETLKDLIEFDDTSTTEQPQTESLKQDLIDLNDDENVDVQETLCEQENTHLVSSELSPDQLKRYSRQLLISNGFGVEGQKKLFASKVLVVGAGGIGSTVLPYLAAAGVGSITVIDHDDVETSNLHRQIMHSVKTISMNKAESACQTLKSLNPQVHCTPINDYFNATNALSLTSSHDVVVDATDNPKTRYLINDACVLSGSTPLVSGSAMGTEGQMTVYNYGEHACCYRCLYPKINAAEGCKSCSDNGVLGPVPGLIGILQAMEVIKILTGVGTVMHDRLIMYDSFNCSFLNIKKPPGKKSSCPVCGPEAYIKSMDDSLRASQTARGPDGLCSMKEKTQKTGQFPELPSNLNISCQEYNVLRQDRHRPHILLDVRVKHQYQICSMDDSINIPLEELESRMDEVKALSDDWNKKIFCICRRGIASAEATRMINEQMIADKGEDSGLILNIVGGLNAWADEVDPNIPMY